MKVIPKCKCRCFEERKNGAHKHRSLFSKTSASKYSRHVVLCKKHNQQKNKKELPTVLSYSTVLTLLETFRYGHSLWRADKIWRRKKRKKNGAHKHLSLFSKTCAQNIHVMLSYANNQKSRQIQKFRCDYWIASRICQCTASSYNFVFFEQRRILILRKEEDDQVFNLLVFDEDEQDEDHHNSEHKITPSC